MLKQSEPVTGRVFHTDAFLMKPNKELKHLEPDPDTVTFLMKSIKKLKHSEPDTDRAPHGHFLNEID